MKIPALALFERTIRQEARSPLMGWMRAGLLAVILMFLIPVQSMARIGFYGAPGLHFLQEMVWINFVFITLAGLSYFASSITEEKEEMMLGLLRMTDLNAVAILLGKSTSRLVGALLLLVVQIPFVLLAVTLGGVGMVQIAAAYGTLLAYVFLVCNLALLFSVVFRNTRIAGSITMVALLLFLFGPFWISAAEQSLAASYNLNLNQNSWTAFNTVVGWWGKSVPTGRMGEIFRTGFSGPAIGFQVISNIVIGIFFFLLSWALFDRCTRHDKDPSAARPLLLFRTKRRSRFPARITGLQAITWKEFIFVTGGWPGLLIKFVVVGLIIAICDVIAVKNGTQITKEFQGGALIWVSLIATAVWLAGEASRIFNEEMRWKTFSSLVTLPISIPELAYRKVAGALAGTLPLLAFFFVGVLMVPDSVAKFFHDLAERPTSFGFLAIAILQYVAFLHLTVFLSLLIKRGALPLAFAIQYLGGTFFLGFISAFVAGGDATGICFLTGTFFLGVIGGLLVAIRYRLERLAAEE